MVLPASTTSTHWRSLLTPWCRSIQGMFRLSRLPRIDVAPTREDLAAITIELSMDRIGRDRGLWLVLLEALELFHLVSQLDARLAWTFLLEACGKCPIDQLAFPLAWLDDVRPLYVLRFNERELLDGFEQISDIFDVITSGIAEWYHSPLFRDVEDTLVAALEAPAARSSWIDITCEFVFEDSPPEDMDLWPDCLATIKNLAATLRVHQEPISPRYWDDSPFYMASFGIDFGDCYLLSSELAKLTQIMVELSVWSLTFSAWLSASTPPPLVGDFCRFGIASATTHAEQFGGLQSLTLYATDLAKIERLALAQAIRTSWILQEVVFFDRGSRTPVADGWLALLLETLFGDDTESQVESVQLNLSRTTLPEIMAAQQLLERKHGSRHSAARPKLPTVQFVPINYYNFSVHDFTNPQASAYPVLQQPIAVMLFPFSSGDRIDNVVMPKPAPHRLTQHPVRSLTISLSGDEDGRSTTAEAVALVWLVGEPLLRLVLLGPMTPDVDKPVLSAIQLERVLTACANVVRLELHGLEIESLEPLTDSSLSANIDSLVIDQCHVQDTASVLAFYTALGDPTHDLIGALRDLSMCEEEQDDATGNLELANAALDMLAHNHRLERFVLRGHANGAARKLQHRFRLFHGQSVAGTRDEMVPVPAKTAFLSVLGAIYDQKKAIDIKQLVEEASTRVFEFAAIPCRRHCVVVPV